MKTHAHTQTQKNPRHVNLFPYGLVSSKKSFKYFLEKLLLSFIQCYSDYEHRTLPLLGTDGIEWVLQLPSSLCSLMLLSTVNGNFTLKEIKNKPRSTRKVHLYLHPLFFNPL